MKISFLRNNTFIVWIDYSINDYCIAIWELNEQETQDLINWKDYKLSNIDDEKNCTINLYDWEKWTEYLNKIEIEKNEIEKIQIIDDIKDLWKQGQELRSKYLSAELLPESEIKTETLRILKEKWDLVMSEYVEKQKTLVDKYWAEILQEIL